MSKLLSTVLALLGGIFLISFCTNPNNPTNQVDLSVGTASAGSQIPFPDFGFMAPPDSVTSEVFKLSQNYPTTLPTTPLPPFFKTDYQKDWRNYLLQVRDYCFEGNTEVDFRVEKNQTRTWYHMPWQHYGPNGREGFHGLTKEAPVKPQQLAPTQTNATSGAWAIGFFNDIAGYTIGEVWKNHDNPDVNAMKGGFKNGTVLFKILFLSMPKAEAEVQVPFLKNGIWWDAYATYNFNSKARSKIQVALIQMDIMVRDDRSPNGWIFGNFQYNGAQNKANPWENLVPVGIMWGQDPTVTTNASNPTPSRTIINPDLKETIINPDANELPATHLGWNSRLNGPVDNPMSSCYSCHATAEFPQGSPISPLFNSDSAKVNPPGSAGWMRWFENLACGQPFDQGHASTDFCLQMAEALQNFDDWKAKQDGMFATAYQKQSAASRRMVAAPQSVKNGQKPIFSLDRRNQ
jgi:hypothetical protein